MKKENRKMAQQRRAKKRARRARIDKAKKIVPVVIVVALIALVVILTIFSSNDDSGESVSGSSAVSTSSVSSASGSETLDTTAGTVVQDGDTVNIDYVGTIDGEEFDGGSTDGQGTDLTLGSGAYIDGFEEGIVGHTVGETFDVNVTFPEDYGVDSLNGKDATFSVTINGVYR